MIRVKKTGLIVLVALVAIQFVRPELNKGNESQPAGISRMYKVPVAVQSVLKNACYDCHSNKTNYPWYSRIEPFGWWLERHIREGKEELNFSEFGNYSPRRQRSKLFAVEKSIEDGTMPIRSYTFMHKEARLTKEQKRLVMNWADKIKDSINKKDE